MPKTKTPKKGWNKTKNEDLTLPSGEVCKVKRPGLEAFISRGLIPDPLMPFIMDQLNKAKGTPPGKSEVGEKDLSKLMKDPAKLAAMIDLVDAVLVDVVIEPTVLPVPENNEDRRDDVFYPDEVDLEDKMFIFAYAVGGTRDLERFRAESAGALAGVEDVAGVPVPTE